MADSAESISLDDALDRHLNGLPDAEVSPDGMWGLRILFVIDEARQILRTKLPSLPCLIRMRCSKGGSVMLISQLPDDLSGEDDEFLGNMGLVAAFSKSAKPGAAARVLGKGATPHRFAKQSVLCSCRQDNKKIKAW